ncbi:hypothetical protein ABZ519_40885 [Streptomyces collinus]|uniref:hypothetical protein n=1 Tax=Streptomyces collinus TaxID=42684 RepID=UPI0033EF7795
MDFDEAFECPGFVERFQVFVLDGCGEGGLQQSVGVGGEGVVDADRTSSRPASLAPAASVR